MVSLCDMVEKFYPMVKRHIPRLSFWLGRRGVEGGGVGVEPREKEAFCICWYECRGEVTSVNHWRPSTLSGVNLIY